MLDISATLEAILNDVASWTEDDPAFEDLVFRFDEFDPKNPKLQILFQNGPDKKTWVTKGIYRIEHQCTISIYIRPTNYKPATIALFKTTFLNMKTEIDRILSGVELTILSGWKDIDFEIGRDTGLTHHEPITFKATQTVTSTLSSSTDIFAPLEAPHYEGDYTTWTLQSYCPLSLPSFPSTLWVAWDTQNDLMYILESGTLYVVHLDTGEYDTYASTDAYFYSQCVSLTGRYFVAYTTSVGIRVFKDGVIVQTLNPTNSGGIGVYISPDGKWIVYQSWTTPAYVCDPLYIYKGT